MTRTTWSAVARQAMERQETDEALLLFAELSHPSFPAPIRVVNDAGTVGGAAMLYTWRGADWAAFPFDLEYVSDDENFPVGKVTIQNVDQAIGERLAAVSTPMRLDIWVLHASDFDLAANPRVGLSGDPDPDAEALHLYLVDVTVDPLQASGTIRSWDYSQDTWPARRATQDRFPALYR